MGNSARVATYEASSHPTMNGPLDIFDFISPLDTRYYGDNKPLFEALKPFLSESATIKYQLKVEQAILATLERLGVAPRGISRRAAEAAKQISPKEVYEEEHRTHHNIRAVVNCLRNRLPDGDRGYVHLFATSADIQDTARSLAMRDVTREVLIPDLRKLIEHLIKLAREHADVPQIGRTHGRFAEPITVGYWLANYVMRLTQRAEAIARTAANLRGMYSGAVGAHSALSLKWPFDPALVEKDVLELLGLKPGDGAVSTQVIQPEYLADYGHAVVSTFSVFANLADDYRHLMRSEIEEVRERLDTYQVGSSTMPHKINPKNFENVKSLWKEFMPRMITVYLDQISEHQRDLTNSASIRFFNELVAAFTYSTRRLYDAVAKTIVDRERVRMNLEASFRDIIAEPLYISFALAGHRDPYDIVHSLVMKASQDGETLLDAINKHEEAKALWEKLPQERRHMILHPDQYIGDSSQRTELVCDDAEMRIGRTIETQLLRPAEDVALVV